MNKTLSDFLSYLRFELNRAPLTVEAYKTDINQFAYWISPQEPEAVVFESVMPSDVRAWLASLARQGDIPRTLRRKIISLRSFFKWMLKKGLIAKSPLRDIPLPKIPKPLPDLVKPDEIEIAIDNLRSGKNLPKEKSNSEETNLLDSLVVETLYSLGLRRAELAGINNSDISSDKAEIKVTGKRSKQRVIPLPQALLDKIKVWQNFRDSSQNISPDEDALFTIKGKRISHSQIYRIVNNALQESSARKKSPHALRHSFASGMLNGGAEIDSVREFLGHASLATTQIYTHVSLREIKKAYSLAHPRATSNDSYDK